MRWMRLRDMLLWLYRIKNWVIRGDYRQTTEIQSSFTKARSIVVKL